VQKVPHLPDHLASKGQLSDAELPYIAGGEKGKGFLRQVVKYKPARQSELKLEVGCRSRVRPGVVGQEGSSHRNGKAADFARVIQVLAVVIWHEYRLHGLGNIRDSRIRGVAEVDDDVVEGGGRANEIHEPKDGPTRAMKSKNSQSRKDDGSRCPWYTG